MSDNGWISVRDRLPPGDLSFDCDFSIHVIAWIPFEEDSWNVFYDFVSRCWRSSESDAIVEPSHWQPLPPPPTENDQ